MAFHSVLVIEYDGTPTVDTVVTQNVTNTNRTKITDLAREIVWSAVRYFNAVVNFLSGRPYNPADIPEDVITTTSTQQVVQTSPVDNATLEKELKQTVKYFVSAHQQELLRIKGPPGSRPGQYPRYRTTNLAKSISYKMDASGIKAKVGYRDRNGPTGNPADYSQWLADRGRKSIPDTAMSLSPLKTQSGYLLQWSYDTEGYV
jgi:hypothetical protein